MIYNETSSQLDDYYLFTCKAYLAVLVFLLTSLYYIQPTAVNIGIWHLTRFLFSFYDVIILVYAIAV